MAITIASVESITVELFFVLTRIPTIVIGMVSTTVAGVMILTFYTAIMKKEITVFKSWKILIVIGCSFAFTQFTWFDAVGRIGAGRVALINIPLEIITIVILSWLVLSERLHRIQMVGAVIVIGGIVFALSSDLSTTTGDGSTKIAQFGIGEVEAILTSLTSAIETVLITKLLTKHNPLEVSAFVLIVSGITLNINWLFLDTTQIASSVVANPSVLLYLFLIAPLIPLGLMLSMSISLKRIGASLSSIIWSFTTILTVILSIIIASFGVPLAVPESITMAIVGGVVSIGGIGVIFSSSSSSSSSSRQGR